MRYKLIVIICLIVGICGFYQVKAKDFVWPLLGKVIYLDPGHGGLDPGALYKDIYEKDINLAITLKLEERLTQLGAIVYLTRYDDYDLSVNYTINRKRSDLSRRVNMINKSGCDLYLSIHLNAETSSTWKGAQAFYDDIHDNNKLIANIMQEEMAKMLNTKRKYKQVSDLYLQRRVERPGVLLEVGFISNPNERYLLQKEYYQKRIAEAIMNGVIRYFSS